MKRYLLILAVLAIAFTGTRLSAAEQPAGEEVVIISETGDSRSMNNDVSVYKTSTSIDVYIQHYSGMVNVSIEDSFGFEVASASCNISGFGRVSVPLTGLDAGTYCLKVSAGNAYWGVFVK